MVKGRTTPTWIFELVARMKDATPEQKQVSQLSNLALEYYMNRDFERCMEQLSKIEVLLPGDKAVLLRKENCENWIKSPPPEGWTAAEELSEKYA